MRNAIVSILLLACSCTSPSNAPSQVNGSYACTVTQVRTGGCGEPRPAGFLDGGGASFSMAIDGGRVEVPGVFDCDGTWSAGMFVCSIPGVAADGSACGDVPWAIVTSGQTPNTDQPLAPHQVWAGTYVPAHGGGNGFDAVCSLMGS